MESLEIKAKTVEEAIERGLQQLGLTRAEVEISVLNKGRSGFLGVGAEEALVRLTPLTRAAQESELPALAKAALEEILSRMKLNARVELRYDVQDNAESDMPSITLDVSGEDLGVLIGRRGETLAALQFILRLIVAHQHKAKVPLSVDIEGYKQRRYRSLRELALRLAQKAISTKQSMTLEPMPADERRVVHLALSVNPEVSTKSIGEGELRKVVIIPRKR